MKTIICVQAGWGGWDVGARAWPDLLLSFLPIFQTATNVAEYNVLSIFHEIATRTKYVLPEPEEDAKEMENKGPTITGHIFMQYSLIFFPFFCIQSI